MGSGRAERPFWGRVYEPIIRKSSGLGRAPKAVDPDTYASRYAHCDVLIVGGGPAGLAAALAASQGGARVILADEQAELGGGLLSDPKSRIDGEDAWGWLAATKAALAARENVTILPRTTAFGYYHQNFLGLAERLSDHLAHRQGPRERLWRVRANQVVLATGAVERPLVFAGNDRPGIMLAGAARTYLNRYGVTVGHRACVVTSHDSAYQAAFDLASAGVAIGAIIDVRREVPNPLLDQAARLGIEVLAGHTVTRARGRLRVSGATVARVESGGSVGPARDIPCDALLMSGGWTPSVHLFSQSRGTLSWRDDLGSYVPGVYVQNARSAGACNGRLALCDALNDGAAGDRQTYTVAAEEPCSGRPVDELATSADPARLMAFVDFQNDVTARDVRLAVREGFHSIEHIKRYTTTGMATDQGKTSNLNSLAIASQTLDRPIVERSG